MLKWAKHRVNTKIYSNRVDAKIEFRACMERLTKDLKLYRIAPQDLIKVNIVKVFSSTYSYLIITLEALYLFYDDLYTFI